MPVNVSKSFLHYPEQCRLHVPRHSSDFALNRDCHLNTAALAKSARIVPQRSLQSHVIQ